MQGETDTHLRLPAILDLAASEAFLDIVRAACESESLKVNASDVEVLTIPCIQIILAALKVNPGMTIENPSEAFVSAFSDLALEWRQEGQEDTRQAAEPDARPDGQLDAEPDVQLDAESNGQLNSQSDISAAVADDPESDTCITPDTQMDEAGMTKQILTIDDSRTIRDMLNLTLSEAGFEVLQAVDGQDGIDVLEKQDRIDVVITDINMPNMDGYGVIRHIRGQSRYKSMPVLVLTTESEKEKRNVAREAGATGWMVKPFDPERLIATINKVTP